MFHRLLLVVLTALGLGLPVQAQDPVDSAAYLLVIDHSGSMNEQDVPGRSRWEIMVERAEGFLQDAPLESLIWIGVFDAPASDMKVTERVLNTEADRAKLIEFIRSQPGPDGGTALYDALFEAFTRAQDLSEKTPGRYVSVMVYSDGVDRDSRKSQQDLQKLFGKLVGINGNIWCFLTPLVDNLAPALLPGGNIQVGTPKRPVPVRLTPSSLQLSTPAAGPLEFELELKVPSGSSKVFPAGASLQWEGDFEARFQPATIPLEPGAVSLTLEPQDGQGLDPQTAYTGTLRVLWPEAPKHVLQGPDTVRIGFQKAERPDVEILVPSDGAVLAAGRDYVFEVRTLQGAEVRWSFDGAGTMTGTGARVGHSYPGPGEFTVKVEVRDPRTGLENEASIQVEVIDVVVGIDVPSGQIFAGQPFTFTSSQRGGITGYDWIVEGRTYVGKDDGSFTHTFPRPGSTTVQVRGTHPKVRVESEPLEVTVLEAPSLALLEPQQGGEIPAEAMTELVASATGPATEVVWRLVDAADGSILREDAPVPLVLDPATGTRRSVLRQRFSEAGPSAVRVEVEAVPGLSASAEVTVVPPQRAIRMVQPTAGRALFAGEASTFLAEVEGGGVREVRWQARLEGQADPAVTGTSELTPDGLSTWEPVLQAPRDTTVTIIAEAILDSGADGPRVERSFPLTYPEVTARLVVSGGSRFDDPVLFRVTGDDLVQVTWDFGDGQRETTAAFENSHAYGAHGRFTALIEVEGAGGKKRTFEHLVDIATTAPQAVGRLVMEGDEQASPAPDQTLQLEDSSTGDVVSATWTLDGEPLDPSQRTLVFNDDQRGDHVLVLTVTGPPGAGGKPGATDSMRIEFRIVRYDHALFAVGALAGALLLAIAMKLLLGNGPSRWKYLAVYPFSEEPDDSAIARSLKSKWSRWSGSAVIKVDDLHLGNDRDKDRTMTVLPKSTASERSAFATAIYSHGSPDPEVSGVEVFDATPSEVSWRFWDTGIETLPAGDSWGLRIRRPARSGKHLSGDLALLTLVLVGVAAGLYLLYQHVYLSF